MVMLVPEPEVVTPPGVLVSVQLPEAGNPLNNTLPLETPHVGWVISPTIGAAGVAGAEFISTEAEASEVQTSALVTVYV